jgi:hypothetical protein
MEPEISALMDGELSEADVTRVRAHLDDCRTCSIHARGLDAVSLTLRNWNSSASGEAASAGFRSRVLDAVAAGPTVDPRRVVRGGRWQDAAASVAASFLVPAAAAAAVSFLVLNLNAPGGLPADPGDLEPLDLPSVSTVDASAVAAYGHDPADPDALEALKEELGFDPLELERGAGIPAFDVAVRPEDDAVEDSGSPSGSTADDLDLDGDYRFASWLFSSAEAYDAFLGARERVRQLELALAAREAHDRETVTVAADRSDEVEAPNPLARTLASLKVVGGSGTATFDGLTVYPLVAEDAVATPALSRSQGLRDGLAARHASVRDPWLKKRSTVLVSNSSKDRYLLVLAGEVLQGGRADRMVARDVVVPPGSKHVPVPVFNVDVGRKGGRTTSSRFRTSPGIGGAGLRGMALAQADGEAMASRVRDVLDVLGVTARRRSLADAFDDGGPAAPVLRRVERQVDTLMRPLEDSSAVGFAVAHGRNLLAVEVYGSHDLMWENARRVLTGFAVEAGTVSGGGESPDASAVVAMLESAGNGAYFSGQGPSGATTEWGVLAADGGLLGAGVAEGETLIHASILRGAGNAALAGGVGRGARLDGSTPELGTEGGGSDSGSVPSSAGVGTKDGEAGDPDRDDRKSQPARPSSVDDK